MIAFIRFIRLAITEIARGIKLGWDYTRPEPAS